MVRSIEVSASLRLTAAVGLFFMGAFVSACGVGPNAAVPSSSAARAGRNGATDCHEAVALETNSKLAPAQMRLTLLDARRGRQHLDGSIAALYQAAGERGFTDLGMLVDLSALQIERASVIDGRDPKGDLDKAEENLARALVIDPHSAPALNELALLHLAKAKRLSVEKAREESRCADARPSSYAAVKTGVRDRQELEAAMGICLRGMREHPTYPAFRNTAGLVQFELRDAQAAIRQFDQAVALSPTYTDAQTNLAGSLLSVRQYDAAERAYDRVIALGADGADAYEVHLGRALARRGQINGSNFRAQVASVGSDLERCKQLDPERPEAYYNDAILTEQLQALAAPTEQDSVLQRARSLFDTFIAKAGERPEYAKEVRLAKQRVRDLAPLFGPTTESSVRASQ
jgi:tetratricopeptide (TPR) repeat protein